MTPKKLIRLLTDKVTIKHKQIRDIQIMDKFSFVTVPFTKAEKIVKMFRSRGKKPLITHAKK